MFKNEQLSKEEYEKRIKEIDFGNGREIEKQKISFKEFCDNALRRSVHNVNVANCVGDGLTESKNCHFALRGSKGEDLKYCDIFISTKDSMDLLNSADGENNYESVVVFGSNNRFCMYCRNVESSEFCVECRNCSNCFGCIGLRNKKFHIFNKPFPEDKYWVKVNEIKSKMSERGEYGEFFPLEMGFMPYQSSFGQMYFPLNGELAGKMGIPWYAEPVLRLSTEEVLKNDDLPTNIVDARDDILQRTITCEESGAPYRLTKMELDFYRRMNLPVPRKHPWRRMQDRIKREHGIILYPFLCPQCAETSWSVYNEEDQKRYRIYCEKCYLKEVA